MSNCALCKKRAVEMTSKQFIAFVQNICSEGYNYSDAIEEAIKRLKMTDKEFQDVILKGSC